ncbi:MAG TPA: divalent-cation tolerance protein CutA [Candidatus Polarisedimenticolaceae bacterium]|nr:divalent-cation tolerance protein CutA [Candidatus Polarisedimenticolaceae bacterium]
MSPYAVILSTAGSEAEARSIARALVGRHLAACVNVVPGVRSIYRWEGAVKDEAEWLLVIKTRAERFEEVRTAIRELHSYEQPEVVRLEIAEGDEAYLRWIEAETER